MSNTKPQNQEAQRTLSRIFEKKKKKIEQIQTKKKPTTSKHIKFKD